MDLKQAFLAQNQKRAQAAQQAQQVAQQPSQYQDEPEMAQGDPNADIQAQYAQIVEQLMQQGLSQDEAVAQADQMIQEELARSQTGNTPQEGQQIADEEFQNQFGNVPNAPENRAQNVKKFNTYGRA